MADDPQPRIGVPYEAILGRRLHAGPTTVHYRVAWPDACTFYDAVLGQAPPPGVESLGGAAPRPGSVAVSAEITPCGPDRPWTTAIVAVDYEAPDY